MTRFAHAANGCDVVEMVVPNGTYTVHIVAGDPSSTAGNIYKINAENVTVVNGTPTAAKPWVEGTASVTVTDGRLTLTSPVGAVGNQLISSTLPTAAIRIRRHHHLLRVGIRSISNSMRPRVG